MTAIKFEPEAILRFLDTARLSPPCESSSDLPRKPPLSCEAAAEGTSSVIVPPGSESTPFPPCSDDCCPDLLSLDSDEEDCLSLSSCSSASSTSRGGHERRVSFATPLVTEVNFRARTPESDKPLLFYSEKETTRFRQLYRQERKLMEVSDEESDVQIVTEAPSNQEADGESSVPVEPLGRRRISRVVVEHNDNLETFYDFNDLSNPLHEREASGNDVFFDNDSFWSGSITWY
ncbi:hypothetical protein HJC23_005312 [Cyclotella cryptica]|uniref:Uncharacterized protein n=1 Tax=Cyclotella cryptica TaxID=29204 RepID=A0ABD3PGI2_9STRA